MPRFGKGKPMDHQARAVLKHHLELSSRHAAKEQLHVKGSRTTGKIHSLRTFNSYVTCLKQAGEWARTHHGLRNLKDITTDQAQAYLAHRAAEGLGQKALNNDRTALQFITGQDTLARVAATAERTLSGRAYTPPQVEHIARHQDERNALSTRIAYEAGLRAHELLTLRPADEAQPSGHRTWREERFRGREGVRYIVTGKGGLRREVLLSRETATRLEGCRLEAPCPVTDRGIHYVQHYDIGGGNRWSASFNRASNRALGWSRGAHGLRHAYAQERLEELQQQRMNYHQAREVISQELGHFRGDVLETYLR